MTASTFSAVDGRPGRRPAPLPPEDARLSVVLDLTRRYGASIPDSSTRAVHRTAHLDGRTRIVAARRPGGTWWQLLRRTTLTREHVAQLRAVGVSEVVLKRGMHSATFPLAWLPER